MTFEENKSGEGGVGFGIGAPEVFRRVRVYRVTVQRVVFTPCFVRFYVRLGFPDMSLEYFTAYTRCFRPSTRQLLIHRTPKL